jgi:hypothetical protein
MYIPKYVLTATLQQDIEIFYQRTGAEGRIGDGKSRGLI